uniref:Ion transport domain-containing protein n=1 Tax=Plectus sambesii TaxID=2011161 RepID=A0A914UXB1_9BILA
MRFFASLAHIVNWRSNDDQKTASNGLKAPVVRAHESDDICRIEDSPFYIFRASGQGLLTVVERLLDEDEDRLNAKDSRGWTCLHHASARAKIKIIDLLLGRGADINATDDEGNTALHVAAEKNKRDVIEHLLVHGADGNKLNIKHWAPIHIATMLNHPAIIEELAAFPDLVDVNIGGLNSGTALHLAAIFDLPEVCSVLLKVGCKMCQPCSNGFYPIHMAAKNASTKTLEQLLQQGEGMGYSRVLMLGFCDGENNSPLHSAVNSGDLGAVQVCLNHGARIDVRQSDQATAFHLAATQGTLSIVKAMFEAHKCASPTTYTEVLQSRDVLEMTPLHRAAMFDHPEVVRYLIEQGSDINALDSEQRSPLLLAAVRCGVSSIRVLLSHNASLSVRDDEKHNLLHFMVIYSGSILTEAELGAICAKAQVEENVNLLNQKNVDGCTPLHLASKQGNLRFTESLIALGATVNLKNNEDRSPLHFAARYGRVNTIRRLLASHLGPNMINETDGGGMTALHIASMNGYAKVVQILLHKGALLHKDFLGRTPLHLAAEGGHNPTIRLLLAFHANLIDQCDKENNTALHFAAIANKPQACELLLSYNCSLKDNDAGRSAFDIAIENAQVEVAASMIQHDRWKELLERPSTLYKCALLGLIQTLPEVHKLVLDRCRQISNADIGSPEYCTMVKYGRVELLSHPVCLQFLSMKWRAYGCLFYAVNLTIYLLFIAALTGVVACLDPSLMWGSDDEPSKQPGAVDMPDNNCTSAHEEQFCDPYAFLDVVRRREMNAAEMIMMIYVAIFVVANMFKEFLQLMEQKWAYFTDPVNFTEWTLYITSAMFVFPLFGGNLSVTQWGCCAVAIFLAWFNLLLYLQRLDSVGIYVVMFLQILSTVIRVMVVFSVLLIAFGFTFHILLSYDPRGSFYNPFISVIHAILVTMGGWEFNTIFVEPFLDGKLPFPYLNFFFLVLFIILMPILFVNLLIGLAVGDIEMILKDAKLKRLAMQVEYHTDLEDRLPMWFLNRVDKLSVSIYPNKCSSSRFFGQLMSAFNAMTNFNSATFADGSSSTDLRDTVANNALFDEVGKSKRRLKEVQTQLDKQYDLLRLIVQKMDIISEADQFDEGEDIESSKLQITTLTNSSSANEDFFESSRRLKTCSDNSATKPRSTLRAKSLVNKLS